MILGRSSRLVFEPLAVEHAVPLHAALADPRVYAHLGEAPPSLADVTADFAQRATGTLGRPELRWVNVAVALASSSGAVPDHRVYLGRLEAVLYPDGGDGVWGEIAYLFGAPYWGQGYATEALAWLHAHLAAVAAQVLWAAVAPGNRASLALLDRLGYRVVPPHEAPALGSYDAGDVCLRRRLSASDRAAERGVAADEAAPPSSAGQAQSGPTRC
jgi:RimJ/RimL family protein N-acetyltransferase